METGQGKDNTWFFLWEIRTKASANDTPVLCPHPGNKTKSQRPIFFVLLNCSPCYIKLILRMRKPGLRRVSYFSCRLASHQSLQRHWPHHLLVSGTSVRWRALLWPVATELQAITHCWDAHSVTSLATASEQVGHDQEMITFQPLKTEATCSSGTRHHSGLYSLAVIDSDHLSWTMHCAHSCMCTVSHHPPQESNYYFLLQIRKSLLRMLSSFPKSCS